MNVRAAAALASILLPLALGCANQSGTSPASEVPPLEQPGLADVPPPEPARPGGKETPSVPDELPSEPEEPTPPPAPPDPWGGEDCVQIDDCSPFTVLCRDMASARGWAENNGSPLAPAPVAPKGHEDPVNSRDGLAIYGQVRSRFAPVGKFVPIVFAKTPPLSAAQHAYFQAHPAAWREARDYWSDVRNQDRRYRNLHQTHAKRTGDRERLRQIVLRDGYLFTEDHRLARRIYKVVRLTDLFDEQEIFLRRGDDIQKLHKGRRGYVYAEGGRKGRKASILVYDRVGLDRAELEAPRHWDLQAVRHGLGLYTIQIEAPDRPVVPFRSSFLSGEPVEGALFHHEGRTAVALAGLTPEAWRRLYDDNHDRLAARLAILDAAEAFADEWIRFDEPDIEFGQEDGKLRVAWIEAYQNREDRYSYNGVQYRVFSGDGTPIPPQVCIDFLMDAVERASGNWWQPRGAKRSRTKGSVSWANFDGLRARSVRSLINFAHDNPDILEAHKVPPAKEIEFGRGKRFYRNLEEFPIRFQEADIIVIWGYREDEKRHYHSFFVHEIDPIDGFPTVLSDNAGLAAVRVWNDIMRTAPRRYVHYHLRFRDEWLIEKGIGRGH